MTRICSHLTQQIWNRFSRQFNQLLHPDLMHTATAAAKDINYSSYCLCQNKNIQLKTELKSQRKAESTTCSVFVSDLHSRLSISYCGLLAGDRQHFKSKELQNHLKSQRPLKRLRKVRHETSVQLAQAGPAVLGDMCICVPELAIIRSEVPIPDNQAKVSFPSFKTPKPRILAKSM